MGCTISKLDDLPAVSLCRQRCAFLHDAIHHRHALSAAHISYLNSLHSVSLSLHHFLQFPFSPNSPSLPSNSDSDDHHSSNNNHQPLQTTDHVVVHFNYVKHTPTTPSTVVYQQMPVNPNSVSMGGESSSSPSSYSFYNYSLPYPNMNPNSYYPYYYGYQTYGGDAITSSAYYYGSPPPPPSPPRFSDWDFLNFFQNQNEGYNHYSQYTPSRDSKEVRENEGIPDLELEDIDEEDYQQQPQVVQQVNNDIGHQIVADDSGQKQIVADDGDGNHSESEEDHNSISPEASLNNQTKPSVVDNNNEVNVNNNVVDNEGVEVEYEVNVVDNNNINKVVDDQESSGQRDAFEVAKEIEVQFRKASESGTQVAKMLLGIPLPYNRKHGAYQGVVVPSLSIVSRPSTTASVETTSSVNIADPGHLAFDEKSQNLSSTLHKLYLWEKKLYNEVKTEEKIRVKHDRKCRKLKRLEDRGADFHKVDSTRASIINLSTKLRMAIKVVYKVSMTINKIRDEELWPQLNELIQGLMIMWKSMLECHRSCEAIKETRILGSVGSREKSGDAYLVNKQLERELINWIIQFSNWISAQKGYVRALNNWLMKCLLYEPEETPDGIMPFSPGRIGAPPIFVICNQWSQAMERISEKEVLESMHLFTMTVLQKWEQDRLEMHQQMMVNKDLERNADSGDHKLKKEIQAIERKMVLASGEVKSSLSISENKIYQGDKSCGLQDSLQCIFEAMDTFIDNSVRIYEELLHRSEKERAIG